MFCSGESDIQPVTGRALLDAETLSRLEPAIERELKARIIGGGPTPGQSPLNFSVLSNLLTQLIEGRCSPEDQRRYLLFIAPIARRVCLTHLASSPANAIRVPDLRQVERWLSRLESFDPPSALMIDLRYFAGLTAREIALVMGVSVETVIRDVRFAKAWLAAYVGRPL